MANRAKSIPHWVWAWTVLFLLFGTLPYIVGWQSAGADRTFSGVLLNGLDANSYLANMQLGLHGRWLYALPYTPQHNTPVPLFLVYILLGHVARLTGLSLPLVFHLGRIVGGGVFALAAYRFIAQRMSHPGERRLAFGLLLFTGGVGWIALLVLGGELSGDLREMPDIALGDAVSFLAMASNVHFTLNMALMLWMFTAGEKFVLHGDGRSGRQAILAGIGIVVVHAHQIAVIGLVLGGIVAPGILPVGWALLRRVEVEKTRRDQAFRLIGRLAAVMVPVAVLAAAMTLYTQHDPYLASWLKQGDTYTPPVWSLLVLYGPLLPLAVVGAWHVVKKTQLTSSDPLVGVVWWFVAVLALIYIPVNFQRRFMEGWHVPVVMLATVGWYRVMAPALRKQFSARITRYALWAVVGSVMLSTIFTFTHMLARTWFDDAYLTADQQGAVDWLNQHADLDDVVLTDFDDGNALPARASVRSFLGHWSLTAYVSDRLDDVTHFFDANTPDADRIALLQRFGVDYVYVSENTHELGSFDPAQAAYLTPVYTSPTVQLYAVDEQP